MDKRVDPESSWRVLFNISLSHGEWIKLQKIAYKGFLTFLRSANLLNSQNGVSLLLVEQLWWKHRVMAHPLAIPMPNFLIHTSRTKSVTQEDYFKNREEVYSHGLLNFEGFTDIMNVISVRCYQTRKCAHLHREVGESLKDAIILSSEDCVGLEECVAYTAKHCLKFFIYRNLVHRSTKILLDPMQNEWTIQTNHVVHHIVNNLQDTIIVPLFEYYSGNSGEMNRSQFERFVKDAFPEFTEVQKSSAFSIFYFNINRKERYGWVDNSDTDGNSAPLVFGLDSFVDALLMLSVVAFSDESRFPHHLSITSKVWSAFESYLCPAMTKLSVSYRSKSVIAPSMATDPLFLDSAASAVAHVSCVFPTSIPVDDISSILIGGVNIMIDPAYIVPEGSQHYGIGTLATEANPNRQSGKPIFRRVVKLLKPLPASVLSDGKDTTFSNIQDEIQDKMEEAVTKKSAVSSSSLQFPGVDFFITCTNSTFSDTKISPGTNHSGNKVLLKNINKKSLVNTEEVPSAGSVLSTNPPNHISNLYSPYLDDERCLCMKYARNRVEVLLHESVRNMRLFKLAIMYKKGENIRSDRRNTVSPSNQNRNDYFQFTPIRQMSFSLRDTTGKRIFTSKTIVLKATSTRRPVPSPVLHILQEAFYQKAKPENIISDVPNTSTPFITMSDFENICCRLRLTPDEALTTVECQHAVRESVNASFLLSGRQSDDSDEDPMQYIVQGAWGKVRLSFSQFMEAVAALGLRTRTFMSADSASDLINFLMLVLPTSDLLAGEGQTTLTQTDGILTSEFALPSIEPKTKRSGSTILPYSSRLNGQLKNVLNHCRRQTFASRLDAMHQALKRPPKVMLPGYPSDVLGEEAQPFSCRLNPDLHEASEILKNEFLMKEVTLTTDGNGHLL
ncbi:unnamed protein product [Phytomonas sp. Hart1]|nr:unnamed protein product [Phytomonas sp. Hart1]|eukprot:CCW66445.1 unnamed protein product [Phytomonas sp. isolate Hart1]